MEVFKNGKFAKIRCFLTPLNCFGLNENHKNELV